MQELTAENVGFHVGEMAKAAEILLAASLQPIRLQRFFKVSAEINIWDLRRSGMQANPHATINPTEDATVVVISYDVGHIEKPPCIHVNAGPA